MKKNITLLALMAACSAHAGSMGPVATPTGLPAFISVEGGYTWNKADGLRFDIADIGTIYTNERDSGGTARVAVGLLNPINDTFFLSTEIGWGYYGNIKMNPVATGLFAFDMSGLNLSAINTKTTLSGFDVLAGLVYNQPSYDLFFKAGAMIQNSQTNLEVDFAQLVPDVLTGGVDFKNNRTQAMPEIKLGGAYHITEQLSVLASWSHVFGANKEIRLAINPNEPLGQINVNLQNPTLDVALLGLQYRFS